MNVRHFTIVALRLLGIYCLIVASYMTQGLVSVFAMPVVFERQVSQMIVVSLFPSIVLLLIGTLLLALAPKLANRLSPGLEDSQPGNSWTIEGFQSALFSAVGLLIISFAIPPMFQWVSQLISLMTESPEVRPAIAGHIGDAWTSVILSAIQLLFGVGLFLGGRTVSNFLQHLRAWSPNKQSEERT